MKVLAAGKGWPCLFGVPVILGMLASSCSLTNINADDCEDDAACVGAFGLGSTCSDGFCTEAPSCTTGHDCRRLFGGGACLEERCVDFIPPAPAEACRVFEPDNLMSKSLAGADAPLLVGGVFRLDDSADLPMSKGAQLAIREINETGGLNEGQGLGMLICDNGGPGNSLEGDARRARMHELLDYLAGTLGVPFIVGPVTSSDSLLAVNHIVSRRYPTVLISPSSTSPQLTNVPDRLDPGDQFGLFWRTAPSDVFQGQLLANQVVHQYPTPDLTRSQMSLVFLDDAYGSGLANEFAANWQAAGNTIALHPYDPNPDATIDFAAVAAAVAGDLPDGILMIAIDAGQTASFIEAMAANAMLASTPLYLTDGSKDAAQLLTNTSLSPAAQGIIFNQVIGTAPAAPSGNAFDFFAASLQQAFQIDPRDFAFVPNAYDAAYVGSMGVVFASQDGSGYDGRGVAAGLSRLVAGVPIEIGKNGWGDAKGGLTSGDKSIDVQGISGPLDFITELGEAPGPIEVWRPINQACPPPVMGDPCCSGQTPCFVSIDELQPVVPGN